MEILQENTKVSGKELNELIIKGIEMKNTKTRNIDFIGNIKIKYTNGSYRLVRNEVFIKSEKSDIPRERVADTKTGDEITARNRKPFG